MAFQATGLSVDVGRFCGDEEEYLQWAWPFESKYSRGWTDQGGPKKKKKRVAMRGIGESKAGR